VDTYRKIAEGRQSRQWSQENERGMKEMKNKIRKITKKQLRDFRIISEEISSAIVRSIKLIAYQT
jgi:hypothetical protein